MGHSNWFLKVKLMLEKYGFLYIWNNPVEMNISSFLVIFKQRLIDEFWQGLRGDINSSQVLILYKTIKENFEMEPYLNFLSSKILRTSLTKLRISAHNLRIQTGRYGRERIDRDQRICQLCNLNEIEDEYHFMFICPLYSELRRTFLKQYYVRRPSMFKCTLLLKSNNKSEIVMLSKYINKASILRLDSLNNL
jgi:hypothetical protein